MSADLKVFQSDGTLKGTLGDLMEGRLEEAGANVAQRLLDAAISEGSDMWNRPGKIKLTCTPDPALCVRAARGKFERITRIRVHGRMAATRTSSALEITQFGDQPFFHGVVTAKPFQAQVVIVEDPGGSLRFEFSDLVDIRAVSPSAPEPLRVGADPSSG